ncbi:uncharacterized protein si:ch211-12e13.1 [Danio rerio]|uniref:Uncharacterized protein si:ch211-12e13.1 n=1 Tax=Danio rerio TaxID=7955 RepID=A0A8M9Q4E5_DANRE|nr:uncharacterized protein si:ch211-12e13.1 [Danio rerio]XP_021329686.1 uncharacterized protein si:ch211-12e13.1 [Danio rerio]XP_021332075.1 uncharacterized protein si:ch211-12e13.1 [Danio rerio]|eukprot:XP_009299482.1 uncharacterized protein si:ch211-12e13.1 [Danio rerio]
MDRVSTLVAVASGVSVVYLFHSVFYSSHVIFKTQTVFESQTHLPASLYLMTRYFYQSLRKKRGQMREDKETNDELVLTLINCRYDGTSLRRFCSVSGYGWDYPDSVFRDLPLCFPEFLFKRLITMIVCSDRFKLCPSGLLVVCETVSLSEAVDELKKGPFSLQASVYEYRTVSSGVEVDLTLRASRHQRPVWSSTVTLLSPRSTHTPEAQPDLNITHDPASERCISLAVPWSSAVRCAWVFGDVFGWWRLTRPAAHPLWMLAKCIAEMEKHKGVEVVRAPLTVSVWYKQPVCLPRKVNIRVSENTSETTALFSMEEQRTGTLFVSGQIKRLTTEKAE